MRHALFEAERGMSRSPHHVASVARGACRAPPRAGRAPV